MSEREHGGESQDPWWKQPEHLLKVMVIALFCSLILVSLRQGAEDTHGHGKLPPFNLELLGGGSLKNQDLEGKVVVLNFFATWCGPCRAEIPDLKAFADTQDPSQVMLIGVGAGDEHRLEVRKFVEKLSIRYPVALGGEALLNAVQSDALPTTLFLNRQGEVVRLVQGPVSERFLKGEVSKMLGR